VSIIAFELCGTRTVEVLICPAGQRPDRLRDRSIPNASRVQPNTTHFANPPVFVTLSVRWWHGVASRCLVANFRAVGPSEWTKSSAHRFDFLCNLRHQKSRLLMLQMFAQSPYFSRRSVGVTATANQFVDRLSCDDDFHPFSSPAQSVRDALADAPDDSRRAAKICRQVCVRAKAVRWLATFIGPPGLQARSVRDFLRKRAKNCVDRRMRPHYDATAWTEKWLRPKNSSPFGLLVVVRPHPHDRGRPYTLIASRSDHSFLFHSLFRFENPR